MHFTVVGSRPYQALTPAQAFEPVRAVEAVQYDWAGKFRVRKGEYCVVFDVVEREVVIVAAHHRFRRCMSKVDLVIDGKPYVLIPRAEYVRLVCNGPSPTELRDAREVVAEETGKNLRAARMHAKLTQAELAEKLGVDQGLVSQAETGKRIGDAYARRVLKACKLPANWSRASKDE